MKMTEMQYYQQVDDLGSPRSALAYLSIFFLNLSSNGVVATVVIPGFSEDIDETPSCIAEATSVGGGSNVAGGGTDGCGDGGGELVPDVAAMLEGPFLHDIWKVSSTSSEVGEVAASEVGVVATVASTDVWLWLLGPSRLATSSLSWL